MKQRLILATTPKDAPALAAALGRLGEGWDTPYVLTPWPPDPTPATTATPTAYLLDGPVDPDQAAVLAELVAAAPDARTLRRARLLGVEDRDGAVVEGERKTLREVLTEHDAKAVSLDAAEPKVRG